MAGRPPTDDQPPLPTTHHQPPAAWASVLAYTALAAWHGRAVLAGLTDGIAGDAGDPLLNAAILHWNARQLPYTDAWWQFPIFHPTSDVLALSEHLLGVSVLASPLAWLTGDPIAAYNLTLLLTFPLAALAVYALVWRLTGSAAGAFVAGLAFAFSPYRIAHLSHIQMLAVFYAPLALLGLHGFLDARARARPRAARGWLALFAAAWLLQALANGYLLVFFSTLVGLWVAWFVVVPGRWRELGAIGLAAAVATLPLLPILQRYWVVHARHGFARTMDELHAFSADVAAPLCAPGPLTVWGWLRVGCRLEGELFPGIAIVLLTAAAVWWQVLRRGGVGVPRGTTRAARGLLVVAALAAAAAASVLLLGPWRLDVPFRLSVSAADKPLLVALAAAMLALLLVLVAQARRAATPLGFYLLAAMLLWLLALGPTVTFLGELTGRPGPFALLLMLPGVDGLRVPARFWQMTLLCLAVAAGLITAYGLRGRERRVQGAVLLALSGVIVADGWLERIAVAPVPAPLPPALRGAVVLELPFGRDDAIAATWRAVTGGARTLNGYSGYQPSLAPALAAAAAAEDPALFEAVPREVPLHVLVHDGHPALNALVARQPGAERVGHTGEATDYRLPARDAPLDALPATALPIDSIESPCNPPALAAALDDDPASRWICFPGAGDQVLTIDLGRVARVDAFVYRLGPYAHEFPTEMAIETSRDGAAWEPARAGRILHEVIAGARRDPRHLNIVLRFPARPARYLRVRPIGQPEAFAWSVAGVLVGG